VFGGGGGDFGIVLFRINVASSYFDIYRCSDSDI